MSPGNAVLGYYTLSALSVDVGAWPEDVARKLPKYPFVPATLLGRLAVDRGLRGKGAGEHLLMDALRRALAASRQVASVAVVVDAKDDDAMSFLQALRLYRLRRSAEQALPSHGPRRAAIRLACRAPVRYVVGAQGEGACAANSVFERPTASGPREGGIPCPWTGSLN